MENPEHSALRVRINLREKGFLTAPLATEIFFRIGEIIVVGGGNSALEEAVSLTKCASKVTIIHQFDNFQALEHYVEEAKNNLKINFVMESKIIEFAGDESLKKVRIQNQANTRNYRDNC